MNEDLLIEIMTHCATVGGCDRCPGQRTGCNTARKELAVRLLEMGYETEAEALQECAHEICRHCKINADGITECSRYVLDLFLSSRKEIQPQELVDLI